jgi:hypothetical protein
LLHLAKNDRLQSEDFHSWGFQPRIILGNGRCQECPSCLFWSRRRVFFYTSFSNLQSGAKANF